MRRFLGQGILPIPAIALFGMLGMVSGLSLQAYDFTSGLVGHYLFDGNASDVSGNGNHGTISGAVPGPDRNGLAGKAYVFDGTDDYISGTTWFNGLNDSTVSLWVKVSNTNSGGLLQTGSISVSYGSGAVSPSVFANRNGGPGTAYRYPSSSGTVPLNDWKHVVVSTTAANTMAMWINGSSINLGSQATDGGVGGDYKNLVVGAAQDALSVGGSSYKSYFNGSIDEVRIYDRALPAPEVVALYQLENTPPNTPPTDLNSTAPLAFSENQPIGTVVGEFNATDPDAGATLTYHLVSGAGDGNNSLFTLETNGTLKTASTFDYETNASTYSIRVRVQDEHNASVEGSFTVTLTDVLYEPSRPNHFVDLNSTVNLEMIWVEPGTFTMGSPTNEPGRNPDETEHNVTLTKGFYLGKYEVTQAQYEAVMTGNGNSLSATPSNWPNNPNRPVEMVSWDDVQIFLIRLNAAEQAASHLPAGWSYVLPTEAQWEYACRAGTTTAYSWGNGINATRANYNQSGFGQTCDVGQYAANPWGFYDMHGNVWEWTDDWYGSYTTGSITDPEGTATGSSRAGRGGSWYNSSPILRSAERRSPPGTSYYDLGFRLAFKQTNNNPADLNSTAPLAFSENQPIGTVVGEFNATDPDAGATLTYHLVPGAGDGNNSLFTLETNGTLKTATTFDFESNASTYSIRVQAKDEHNASVEGNFTVTLTNDLTEDSDGDGFSEAEEVSAGTNPNDPASKPGLNFGLVAHWPFDGNASDISGNGNHGTINGAIPGTDRHGIAGNALSFDGNDVVEVPDHASLRLANQMSFGGWIKIKLKSSSQDQQIMAKGNGGSSLGNYVMNLYGTGRAANAVGKVEFGNPEMQGSIPSRWVVIDQRVDDDRWHHVFATYGSGERRLYLDGKFNKSNGSSGPLSTGTSNLFIGNGSGNGRPLLGNLDELRIYDRALSASEVEALYQMESDLPSGSVTTGKLDPSLGKFLDGNATIEQALPAGSVIAVKPGDPAPAGYTLFQRNEYNATLTWEEKAPVSVGRYTYDGIELVNDKIYFVGGNNGADLSIAERYNPATDQWAPISSLNVAKHGVATASLDEKLFVIGGFNYQNGSNFREVKVFDSTSSLWASGTDLPIATRLAAAITFRDKIYLIGGRHDDNSRMNQVLEYSDTLSMWKTKATMPTARNSLKLVVYKDKIWAIGGFADSATQVVESYDQVNNVWSTEASLTTPRISCSAWVANGYIFVAGGSSDGSNRLNTIEYYDPIPKEWKLFGNLPENKTNAGAVTFQNKVFLISGSTANNIYSNKVYAADLPAPAMHLYFKDGNATAEATTSPALDGNVTLNMLAPDALAKLDVNRTHAQSTGSVIAIPRGSQPPPGYSLYKRSDRNETLVWKEKAPVSVAREACDGVEVLNGKIYYVGGFDGTAKNLAERYDPATNQWETLTPMSSARQGVAATVLNGKFYAIGGVGLSSLEIYDPSSGQWSTGPALPSQVNHATAITVAGKILLVGGVNGSGQTMNQVLELDPLTNQWSAKASLLTTRRGAKLVLFKGKVWAFGGADGGDSFLNTVESYDPAADSWSSEASLNMTRHWPSAWATSTNLYVAGGHQSSSNYHKSIEVFSPSSNQWSVGGELPENKVVADAVVIDGKVYIVAGMPSTSNYSNKVFAADITPPMDLYFRDANATGTVTLDKLDGAVVSKLEGNVSALSPIGTVSAIDHNAQPQANQRILECTDRNATHAWEEMAPVSVGRNAFDGVEVLDGKIYFIGGRDGAGAKNITERYDPKTNQWETLAPMSTPREGLAAAFLNGKLYAIGGVGLSSVEVFDPQTGQWSAGTSLPISNPTGLYASRAISANGKILVIGGKTQNQSTDKVFQYDPVTNQWTEKSPMPTARRGHTAVLSDGKVWAISAYPASSKVEIYDIASDSWSAGPDLSISRSQPVAWTENNKIFVASGSSSSGSYLDSIEVYNPTSSQWSNAGSLPESKVAAGVAVLEGMTYIVAGKRNGSDYSDKVYAADLIPHRDLYFREANETVQTPGGGGNQSPTNLNSTAPLAFSENQPIGTVVGEFNASDADAGATLTYHLVSGAGDPHNSLFTLETNGTLKTATTFDFESNASSYAIRVQVKDEFNATVEGNFTVNLINQNEAPVFTNLLAAPYPVVQVQENQKAVTTLTGTDPDGHLLEFILTGPDAHLFELNATTGSLSFLNPPDYESPTDQDSNNSYEIGIFLKESNFSSESTFLAFENFDYPLGEIVGRNGGLGWNGAWQGLQSWKVVDGNVIVDQIPAKGRQILMGEQKVKVRRFFQNPITIGDQAGEYPNIWTMVAIHFKQLVIGHSISFRLKGPSQQAPIVIGKKTNGGISLSYNHAVSDISGALGAKQFALNLRYDQDGNTSMKLYAIGDRTLNQMQTFNPNDMKSFASKVMPGKVNLEQVELYRHNNTQSTIDEIAVFAGELSDDNDGDGISNWNEYLQKRIQLHTEKTLRIEVTDQNDPPSTLNSTDPLAFAENQPIGSAVGEFNASDPDAGTSLTYHLVSGTGATNNSLFTLDANGTLRAATVFDYESNASTYSIRVQAKDESNATVEGNFTVMLTDVYEAPTDQTGGSEDNSSGENNATQPGPDDSNGTNPGNNGTQPGFGDSNASQPDGNGTQVLPGDSNVTNPDANATQPGTPAGDLFQPIVETGEAKKVQKDSVTLRGSLVDNGGARITGRGFLLSAKPNPKPERKNVTRLDANGSKNFQAQATNLKPGKKYFYRAFATNAQGTALGSVEGFTTLAGPLSPSWINAQPGTATNWWSSRWFGNFYLNANGWARHEQLGWVFPMESPTAGLWLWKRELGWLWTDKEIYPFLYQNAQGGWLYFYGQRKGALLFYDYEAKRWITGKEGQ